MTKPSPEVEALAARRLADDESRLATITGAGSRRTNVGLGTAWRSFWRHPSPWMISTFLVGAVAARLLVAVTGDGGSWWELIIPVVLLALFPVIEWVIHVFVLHWRPRRVGPVAVDSLLARKHREHHADPRDIPLVFIPSRALAWLLPAYVVVALLAMPTLTGALSLLVAVYSVKLGYEWTHYLVHSDYRPRSGWYRSVWRNHRLHHYKNEHYWFTVTTAGTADRLLGTYPDPTSVPTSPTVKRLHADEAGRAAS